MKKNILDIRLGFALTLFTLIGDLGASAQTDILEYHGNTSTSGGVNSTETQITPASVNVATFGKQFSTPITDVPNLTGIPSSTLPAGTNYAAPGGQVYAEPLVKTGVTITTGTNQGLHDVVFVATTMDSLYAIDANGGTILWKDSFIYNATGNPNPLNPTIPVGVTAAPGAYGTETNSQDIQPWIGIIDTPVIDGVNGYIYFVAKTREADGNENQPHYVATLHKVRLKDGFDTNTVIADTTYLSGTSYTYNSGPYVIGTGAGAITVNGQSRVYFNAVRQMVRPALVLYGGRIYLASASHGDNNPYHGWVLTYDAGTLTLNGVWNSTPNSTEGEAGIWQGGGGVIIDPANGAIYIETGNGAFDGTGAGLDSNGFPINGDYGDCFVRLALDSTTSQGNQGTNKNGWGLKVVDYFSPYNNASLDSADTDLGSGGPTLLPDSAGSTAHPHLLIGGGKEGKLYLIDRDNMGKFGSTDNVVQTINGSLNGSLSVPSYFNGRLYATPGYGGSTVSWPLSNAIVNTAALQSSPENIAFPGCSPYISANGTNNGVLWEIDHGTGQLRAYDASNLTQGTIWNSNQDATRDSLGSVVKFTVPTPVNGRVYVGTSDHLVAYGPPLPANSPPAAPSFLAAAPTGPNSVALSWTDNSNNESGFLIERSNDNVNFTQIATVGVNVTDFGDSGLSSQATYYYRVRATNGYNTVSYSSYSNVAIATTSSIGTQLPVDLYSFDEGSGSTTIDAATGNNGTLVGSPLPTWMSPGRIGSSSLFFSGNGVANSTSQPAVQVTKDLSPILGTTSSLLFWIKTTQTGNDTHWMAPAVTGVEQAGGGNDIGWGYLDASGHICVAVGDSGTVKSANPINNGSWHHVALTRDATIGTVNVYVDGVLSGSGTLEIGNKTSQFELIGARSDVQNDGLTPNGANYLNAQLDDVRIYNVVVTQALINSLSQPPAAASNLVVTPASGTELDLSWTDNATNATGYEVWSSINGGPFVRLAQLSATATTYVSGSLTQGTPYFYFIRAVSAAGTADSPTIGATTPVPPATPTNATVVNLTATEVDMTWNDNASNEVGYRVLRRTNQADFAQIAQLPPNTTSYADTTVQSGVTYDYHVQAYNIAGVSDFTGFTVTVPTATAPPPATNPAATATSGTTVNLTWVDNATNETAYQVWVSLNGGAYTELIQLPANTTSYAITGLTPGTSYSYFIRTISATGSSDSTTVSVTTPVALPPAATNPTATATSVTTVNLTWVDNATNETAYQVWGSVTGGTPAQVVQLAANTTSYTVTGLTPSVSYTYFIRVINPAGSADSTTVSVTMPATSSTTTYVSDLAYVGVTNGWGPVEKDTSNGESLAGDGHTISIRGTTFAKGLGCHANSEIDVPLNKAYTTFSSMIGIDDEVNGAGSVDFQVVADGVKIYDSGTLTGKSLLQSTGSLNVAGVTTLKLLVNLVGANNANDHADWAGAQVTSGSAQLLPAAATNPVATATSKATIGLSWVDNATNETAYQVWGSVTGGAFAQVTQLAANTTSYTVTGLTPATSYTYFIRALNASGSADSPLVSVTTTAGSTAYVSDLAYVGVTNGWGPVEKDMSNGESAAGDGHTISIRGTTFAKGLGCHANSEIDVPLNKAYSTFTSSIGIDDEVAGAGAVDFQVVADGVLIYDSGTLTNTSPLHSTGSLNVAGVTTLKLLVNLVGVNNANDHADWAGAQVSP